MDFLSQQQIDELCAQHPYDEAKCWNLDAFISYKLQEPDRRGAGNGVWYITGARKIETRDGEDVQFIGYSNGAFSAREAIWTLSTFNHINYKTGRVIELDKDFKPGKLREVYHGEPMLKIVAETLLKKEQAAHIWAGRKDVVEIVYRIFQTVDASGKTAGLIAEGLADDICKDMAATDGEMVPSILRVLVKRLGV